ncbi:hypothetical protein VE02_09583 [Pseudogymnoascus sp. 03VT05]|nr:hypothetical protein VE02_09583 [Pseudogymnoascus sp. 03VT05]
MDIQKLPNEVIRHIFSHLPTSDLKALSLVCWELNDRATPLFLSRLAFWLGPEDLERLAAIAESARLKRHVTTLLIQDGVLQAGAPELAGFIWTFRLQHQPNFDPRRGIDCSVTTDEAFQNTTVADFPESAIPESLKQLGWTPERVFAAYKEHGQIIAEYNKFIHEKRDIEILSVLLQRLTGVTELQLCNWSDTARKTMVDAIVRIRILEPNPLKNGRALARFLQAAATATIPSLSTIVLREELFFEQLDDFGTLDPSVIEASLPALRDLTSLVLPMRTDWSGFVRTRTRSGLADLRRENLAALLVSGLPHLRHLRIFTKEHKQHFALELSPIMDAISSDRLESIDLEFCILTLDSVENFLRRHSKTLKTIRLNNVILIQAHFETLFTLVRDITQLEEMVIASTLVEKSYRGTSYCADGCLESEASQIKARHEKARKEIARFATRKTDRFPRELLDVDSSVVDDIYITETRTCLGVIGKSFVPETWDEEQELEFF